MILIDRDTLQMTFIGGEAMFKELDDDFVKLETLMNKVIYKQTLEML